MITPTQILFSFTLIFAVLTSNGQTNDAAIRQYVLKKNIVDSSFIFGKWSAKGETETHLKYLGKIKTKNGQTLKVLNSSWYWGLSKRATSRILIFDDHNLYLGNYRMAMVNELPLRIDNGRLIFQNIDEHRDKMAITIIDLTKDLPYYGDSLRFEPE
jgi:hypothetical protein